MKLSQLVVRKESTIAEKGAGDRMLLDLNSGRCYTLGETGGFIWSRLDGLSSLEDIAAALVDLFEVDLETAEADLLEFAESVVEFDLAIVAPA